MSDAQPPIDYLVDCSKISLESFELSRLNRASNLRKELSQVVEEWIEAEASSRLARWIGECRRQGATSPHSMGPPRPKLSLFDRLDLPLPAEKQLAEAVEIVLPQTKPVRKRALHPRAISRLGRSARKKKRAATMEAPCASAELPDHPVANVFEDTLRAHKKIARNSQPKQLLSAQALTELKALDEVASGPPEIHCGALTLGSAPLPIGHTDIHPPAKNIAATSGSERLPILQSLTRRRTPHAIHPRKLMSNVIVAARHLVAAS